MRDSVKGLALLAVLGGMSVADHRVTPFDDIFNAAGRERGVDPDLLRAIAKVESNMNPNAIGGPNANGTHDYGLMQINGSTARAYGVTPGTALLVPETNIRLAAHLLVDIRTAVGNDVQRIISAYNSGSGTVLKKGITNAAYVGKVLLQMLLFNIARVFA